MKFICLLGLTLLTCSLYSQEKAASRRSVTIGIEADALPYITGGYYGSVWLGQKHVRYRAIVTKLTTPGFLVEDGFTNNRIQSYTGIVDYFFKPDFKKWWIGAGLEYWKGSIQTDAKISRATYNQTILTLGTGYVWKVYRNFYLNPWAAVHARISGDRHVTVDNQEFEPSKVTPEVSVKVGWHF